LDGIRPQTHLNYHTILFCFASDLEIFSALFILSHTRVSTLYKLCVLCAKFIKLTRGGDGSKLSREHFIPLKNMRISKKFDIVSV